MPVRGCDSGDSSEFIKRIHRFSKLRRALITHSSKDLAACALQIPHWYTQHISMVSKRYKRLCTDPALDQVHTTCPVQTTETHKSTRFAGPPAILSTRQSLPAIAVRSLAAQAAVSSALALTSTPKRLAIIADLVWPTDSSNHSSPSSFTVVPRTAPYLRT